MNYDDIIDRRQVEQFLRDIGTRASGSEEFGEALCELICCAFSGEDREYWILVDEWLSENYPNY